MGLTKDRGQWRSFIRTHRRQMAGVRNWLWRDESQTTTSSIAGPLNIFKKIMIHLCMRECIPYSVRAPTICIQKRGLCSVYIDDRWSRAVRRQRRPAADNLWASLQTFVDLRASADNLSARHRCHYCCSVLILLQFSMTKKMLRTERNFFENLWKKILATAAPPPIFVQNWPARRHRHNGVGARL